MTSKLALLDGLDHHVGDAGGAHLGLQIVGRDLGGRHHLAALAGIGLLVAAVEEVGDVRVLFGFGDAQVLPIQLRHDVGQDVVGMFARQHEGNLEASCRTAVMVVKCRFFGASDRDGLFERGVRQRHGHFAAAVGADS